MILNRDRSWWRSSSESEIISVLICQMISHWLCTTWQSVTLKELHTFYSWLVSFFQQFEVKQLNRLTPVNKATAQTNIHLPVVAMHRVFDIWDLPLRSITTEATGVLFFLHTVFKGNCSCIIIKSTGVNDLTMLVIHSPEVNIFQEEIVPIKSPLCSVEYP